MKQYYLTVLTGDIGETEWFFS